LIAKSATVMSPDFTEALEEEIVNGVCARDRNGSGGFVGIVLRAKFQADAVMVDRLRCRRSSKSHLQQVLRW
jgi:hypothetical protein